MASGILVIDDEAVLAKNIRLYLERSGYEVRTAGSAEEGETLIAEFCPDIILLDYQLPGRSGLELLASLRNLGGGIPVIMLTGQGSVDLAVEAMKLGAVDFLTKPLVLSKLRLSIEKALGGERSQTALAYYRDRDSEGGVAALIGNSPPMQRLKSTLVRILEAEAALGDDEPPAVLISGETGTGKELVARALHQDGPRRRGPFIELNCGSIPPALLEAELFGHERGAFTDARERKLGLVEAADGGTLFLDEIGDMEPALQVKLLKLLEEKTVRRLGSIRDQRVNVRIVAATHQPLEKLVGEGRFRSDLYFRLRIVELSVPPLRERGDDILLLARHFLALHSARYRKAGLAFSPDAERALRAYAWPGNVRELRNALEQATLLADGPVIVTAALPFCTLLGGDRALGPATPAGSQGASSGQTLDQIEKDVLTQALNRSGWNVTHAARILGISRDTLRYRIDKHGLAKQG
ncbi:MAG TPA: sigma-54 dependent transcriptional regulator [Rhodocyclaceae bacterium]|jgi:DNA-binding NtrC family response regulator|nr:sigma-54-dependent Fis family transcriptional regulator [Betaproteobacteria bacterium]HMU99804.1 sigma-54 dependent transcriptional regulator [Rhodocyclaceae bacterium]HMW77803.1 sigma-54 dependent transcriptional regulator [Rhodocyclaceae bacterium]HNE43956.1 sigma-54 dependent transcriptional regulator [Rhodocyclaceae bacterium]HNL21221.1 sigma-54 dependent transcriptional regulator [Rhodocyclaceae bacterium]